MITLQSTALSILKDGFDSHREPVDVAWADDVGDATGSIDDGSVRIVDGFQRVLACMMIVNLLMKQDLFAPTRDIWQSWI